MYLIFEELEDAFLSLTSTLASYLSAFHHRLFYSPPQLTFDIPIVVANLGYAYSVHDNVGWLHEDVSQAILDYFVVDRSREDAMDPSDHYLDRWPILRSVPEGSRVYVWEWEQGRSLDDDERELVQLFADALGAAIILVRECRLWGSEDFEEVVDVFMWRENRRERDGWKNLDVVFKKFNIEARELARTKAAEEADPAMSWIFPDPQTYSTPSESSGSGREGG